nr:hypothetical protein [uncultured Moellerella sp.]
MFKYPASVEFDEETDSYEISYRDFPDLQGTAYAEEDIELDASDTLLTGIDDLITARIPIPSPSPQAETDILVHLPVLACLKIALHNAMIQTGTRKADLARKLNQKAPQIDRLLDVNHASKVETLEQALYLLGYEVAVQVNKK